jgi:ATP-binding cassette subfamily F protein 3
MLTVSQLSKSFAGRALFDDVSLQVNRGDRIGLVGPNGAGKSTLFALLLGEVSPDNGTIAIEKNATIGFLPQETAAAGDETVLELALAVSPALVQAQKVIKEHEAAVAGIADPGADAAYHNALHVFDERGGLTSPRLHALNVATLLRVQSHCYREPALHRIRRWSRRQPENGR